MREQIVHKINNEELFSLSPEEVGYIVKNWIELHSQHKVYCCTVDMQNASTIIQLDKQSIFKSHI